MSARYYTLIHRSRGLMRWGAEDDRTSDVIWCFTRWGAQRWIEMHSHDQYEYPK